MARLLRWRRLHHALPLYHCILVGYIADACVCNMQYCMVWKNAAFDWNLARAFLVTAEEGSFSGAARALGLAQPTLGRQVTAFEAELGVALFERVGHRLILTTAGLELLEEVRAMGDAATRLSLAAAGRTQALVGIVRIAASE